MIKIASPATLQLSSLSPLVVRPRRRRSPDDAPGAYRERDCRKKYDRNAGHERLFPTLHPPKSFSALAPTIRRRPPAPLKSP